MKDELEHWPGGTEESQEPPSVSIAGLWAET
jgi:hypothetical protein